MSDPADILTLDEAAALLRVSTDVVYRLASAGRIPCARVGAQWRFTRRKLLEWLESPASNDASAAGSPSRSAAASSRPSSRAASRCGVGCGVRARSSRSRRAAAARSRLLCETAAREFG